jgi:hypothetical protein
MFAHQLAVRDAIDLFRGVFISILSGMKWVVVRLVRCILRWVVAALSLPFSIPIQILGRLGAGTYSNLLTTTCCIIKLIPLCSCVGSSPFQQSQSSLTPSPPLQLVFKLSSSKVFTSDFQPDHTPAVDIMQRLISAGHLDGGVRDEGPRHRHGY